MDRGRRLFSLTCLGAVNLLPGVSGSLWEWGWGCGCGDTALILPAPCAPAPPTHPTQLNKAFQAEESPGVIYCISMQWFREWEAFVKGKDNGEWSRGPRPHHAWHAPGWEGLGVWVCWESWGGEEGAPESVPAQQVFEATASGERPAGERRRQVLF